MTREQDYKQVPEKTPMQKYWRSLVLSPQEAEKIKMQAEEKARIDRIFLKHVTPYNFSPRDPFGLFNIVSIGNFYYNLFYFNQREK
jgi:hypothetical protein